MGLIAGTVAAIVGIAVSVAMGLTNVYSIGIQHLNARTKSHLDSLISKIREQITANRLNTNKILSYLKSGNTQALMSYMYTNPVISANAEEINKAAADLAKYEADLTAIESEMQSIQNELSSKGYAQSISGAKKEHNSRKDYEKRLKELDADYNNTMNNIKSINPSGTKRTHVITSDIDARAQNITGGLNNNAKI